MPQSRRARRLGSELDNRRPHVGEAADVIANVVSLVARTRESESLYEREDLVNEASRAVRVAHHEVL